MPLGPGTKLGPYEVLAPLGAGGMGEVYRARDTRLDRIVALKVLPEHLAANPDLRQRLEREARAVSSLNHPHICALYDVGQQDGTDFLVMELLEGETLADCLGRGPLPTGQVLRYGIEIADALDKAHRQGIVHRDLKPGNVMLTKSGAKLLDFGLAKLQTASSATGASVLSAVATAQRPLTEHGTVLGTFQYMAPEQLEGKEADARTDLFALGSLLYEMATGRKAFTGKSQASLIAAILSTEPPPLSSLQPLAPPSLERLVKACLAKDPDDRLQTSHDVMQELKWIVEAGSAAGVAAPVAAARRKIGERLAFLLAAGLGASTLLLIWARPHDSTGSRPATRLELILPTGVELSMNYAQSTALSPDGTRVAFAGMLAGARRLYVRRLDEFEAVPLAGTERLTSCFFSPDGRAIGFITNDEVVKKVSLADGLVITLARGVNFYGGGAWGADDRIIFNRAGVLWQVPASGGAPAQLTTLDAAKHELSHVFPAILPGGQAILFASVTGSRRDAAHIEALSLATRTRRVLIEGTAPLYAPSGHLVFFRDGALLAAPLDADRLELTGPPVRLVETLAIDFAGVPVAAVSSTGTLVYAPGDTPVGRLVWVSRQGVEQSINDALKGYMNPRLAPDGRQIVVSATGDLWVLDLARGAFARMTSEETAGNNFPVWSAAGKRVVFRTLTGLYSLDADGGGHAEAVPGTSSADFPTSVSPDGDTLALSRFGPDISSDVYVVSLRGEPNPRALVSTTAFEGGAQFSPDGRYMAYVAAESGQSQVYLRPFPGPDRKWQVSTQSGTQPRWNRNGRELFYRQGNKMMVVDVSLGPDPALSPPRLLFDQRYAFNNASVANYDVSLDGQRFLMVKDEQGAGRLNVVLNWSEELKRRVPGAGR